MPSFRSSPWILGAPQRGFAVARRATRALISAVTGGRPPIGRAASRVQYARKRHRCHLRTVSGVTITRGCLHLVQALARLARPRKDDPSCEAGAGSPAACRRRVADAGQGSRSRAGGGRRRRTGADGADFLWLLSSDFFLSPLPQLVPRHRRQVMLLVIRDVAVPHHEDDLQPLGAQRPQGRMMIVTPRPLLVVVRPGPFTLPQREECHLIDDVTHRLVTGESEPNDLLLAAPDCHGHSAGVPLEVLKRFPPPGGVPQEGPERKPFRQLLRQLLR